MPFDSDPPPTSPQGASAPSNPPSSASPDGQGTGSVSTPSPSPAPPVSPANPGSSVAAADPNPPAAATGTPGAPAAPPAPQVPSWLSQLRESGVDLGTDEAKARETLAQVYRDYGQLKSIAPYVSAYMQHAKQFSDYLQSQNQPKPATPGAPGSSDDPYWKSYFNPPEFNPAWEKQIVKDAQGNLVPAPGAPADVVARYQAYQQFRNDQAERFLSNPHTYMESTIKYLARQEAERLIRDQFSHKDNATAAREFVQQNMNWLYEMENGQPKTTLAFNPMSGDYVQTPVLSQWGQAFQRYARERQAYQQKMGVAFDEKDMKDFAYAMVQRDFAIAQMHRQQPAAPATAPAAPAAPPPTPQQQANDSFLRRNNPPAGQPPTGGNTIPKSPEINRMNLEQVMAQRLGGLN